MASGPDAVRQVYRLSGKPWADNTIPGYRRVEAVAQWTMTLLEKTL